MEEDGKMSMLGAYSEDLHYVSGQLFLTYENGRVCSGREPYQAEISFMCSNEYFPRNGPQYVGSIGCRHMFMFYTNLACERDSVSITRITKTVILIFSRLLLFL